MTLSLSDTSTWLPLDGLAPGFDANKGPLCTDLDSLTFTFGPYTATFTGSDVSWNGATVPCETFLVDDRLYYAQFLHDNKAVSLLLDVREGQTLVVTSRLGSGLPRVTQSFEPFPLDGAEGHGDMMAPSTALIGRRAMWVYSGEHTYEHVYLSPHWYTWQCLAGPERGLADTDENSVYRVRPGIYVFTWREKVIPCGAFTIADHRDTTNLRSHGALFGLGSAGETEHFTFGAYGRLLSLTAHPADVDPARG